jgi:biotin-(acetyl-CoA carboxylase) ligase
VLDAWRKRDALRGEHVTWSGGSGVAAGISESGALVVETDGGERVELDAGEVHLGR